MAGSQKRIGEYLKVYRKNLHLSRDKINERVDMLQSEIGIFLDMNPSASYDEFYREFGNPKTFGETVTNEMPENIVHKTPVSKKVRIIVASVITLLAIISVAIIIAFLINRDKEGIQQYSNNGASENGEEVIIVDDDDIKNNEGEKT